MIRAEGLCKTLAGRAVLHGASLEIPDGSTVGLYGRSGIGKTTIARCSAGCCCRTRGRYAWTASC